MYPDVCLWSIMRFLLWTLLITDQKEKYGRVNLQSFNCLDGAEHRNIEINVESEKLFDIVWWFENMYFLAYVRNRFKLFALNNNRCCLKPSRIVSLCKNRWIKEWRFTETQESDSGTSATNKNNAGSYILITVFEA